MPRSDGDVSWDEGPPGTETCPPAPSIGPVNPHTRGAAQTVYPSYPSQSEASNSRYGYSGDDSFLYPSNQSSGNASSPVKSYGYDSTYPISRHPQSQSYKYNGNRKYHRKYRRSRSNSSKRFRSQSKSPERCFSSRGKNYGRSSQFSNERSHQRLSRKQRRHSSSSSSDSSSLSSRDRSSSREKKNNAIKSSKHSRISRSRSPESSSSKYSNTSSKYISTYSGGDRTTNSKTPQGRKSSSPESRDSVIHNNHKSRKIGILPNSVNPIHSKKMKSQAPPVAPFKNDGSFLEMFKKLQENQKMEIASTSAEVEEPEIKKPALPMVGKRRGGRVLKTGMVKKPKSIEEQTVDNSPTDAWSLYLKEVKKYKEASCDQECMMRPLFK